MQRRVLGSALAALASGFVVLAAQAPVPSPATYATTLAVTTSNLSELREWDGRITALERSGALALRTVRRDTLLRVRTHERYDQTVGGVRVFGGDIVRQTAGGVTESVFGTLYDRINIGTTPLLSEDDARDRFAELSTSEFPHTRPVELVILPRDEGGYTLTWRSHVRSADGWMHTFVDARTGTVVLQYDDWQTQAAVGTGTGVLGDRKKISGRSSAGRYYADDQLRPPLITFDMQGNHLRADAFLEGRYRPAASDVANDADNVWADGATVDAHAYLGWTYDYYFKRFGRRGLDDRDVPISAITHPVHRADLQSLPDSVVSDYVLNAFWCGGCGPDGRGVMVFGEGLPSDYRLVATGQYVDYLAGALDVVAHELTHGLTDNSSRLVYRNESGALNESISDIFGTGAEFFYQRAGSGNGQSDYLIGEDVFRPGGIRSMADPQAFGDPDHYTRRFRGAEDNGGVHINSGIPNHAFYLAVEGGVNRTSGLGVTGVGGANREQIEKAFYRAFTSFLTSGASFGAARAATIQSARELYGAGSPAERAITEAWTAVGVN